MFNYSSYSSLAFKWWHDINPVVSVPQVHCGICRWTWATPVCHSSYAQRSVSCMRTADWWWASFRIQTRVVNTPGMSCYVLMRPSTTQPGHWCHLDGFVVFQIFQFLYDLFTYFDLHMWKYLHDLLVTGGNWMNWCVWIHLYCNVHDSIYSIDLNDLIYLMLFICHGYGKCGKIWTLWTFAGFVDSHWCHCWPTALLPRYLPAGPRYVGGAGALAMVDPAKVDPGTLKKEDLAQDTVSYLMFLCFKGWFKFDVVYVILWFFHFFGFH